MKLASFYNDGGIGYGVVTGQGENATITQPSAAFLSRHPSLKSVLEHDALNALATDTNATAAVLRVAETRLAPPVYNAGKVICVGINYPKKYPLDNPAAPPEHIILFAKLPGTLVGHLEPLEIPPKPADRTFDYEGEIALVIGKGGRHIPRSEAFACIAGYTILNDGSVREWQKHSAHAGKNFANSGACGPWVVTAEEVPAPLAIRLQTRLNGEVVQDTTADQMVFDIPELIAYISNTIALNPGDLIATGSPEGSGGSRTPPRFLKAGDFLEIECSSIGILQNRVGALSPRP